MKTINRVLVGICLLLPMLGINAKENPHYEIPRTQVVPIKDTEMGGQYELIIKLPQSYEEKKTKVYPVIYFTDAAWSVELLSAASEFILEDVILVGISWQKDMNSDLFKEKGEFVSRFRDYSTRKSNKPEKQAKYQFGQASSHLRFIRDEVITTVEKNYRTDVSNRTYFGYSLGGLFGAYILSSQPELFKHYIIGSPSLKKDINYLNELENKTAKNRKGLNANVFITYGDLEKKRGKQIDEYVSVFNAKSDESLNITLAVVKGDHSQAFPATGIRGVSWLAELMKGAQSDDLASVTTKVN